jgi:hypothetical protein
MIKALLNIFPMGVSSGPFRGTKCAFTSTGDGVVAKLAGTYEMEIYPAFEKAIAGRPGIVADIGAAEGFYVAALARVLPDARVIAYEAKDEWHERIRRIVVLNGMPGRCEVRGFCDRNALCALLDESSGRRLFILMDIEGGEFDLLTPETLPLLQDTELLVELHEPNSREAGDALISALSMSHEVTVYWSKPERLADDIAGGIWKRLASMFPAVRRRLDERRIYKMRWIHAVPHTRMSADVS